MTYAQFSDIILETSSLTDEFVNVPRTIDITLIQEYMIY